jgi:hypothetical protein
MINTRVDLAKYFGGMGYKTGAEIGVAKGKYSRVFCWNIPKLTLFCVDPYSSDPNDLCDYGADNKANYDHAKKILQPFNAIFILHNSTDALTYFGDNSLDFVYIDANHSFDYVMMDIINWSRKVRSGGTISGHDYYRLRNFGVIAAVNAYVKAHGITTFGTTDGDHTPSWYWTKP